MGRPAVKKKLIDEAAIKLFATKGLAGTVIKDIAREAGVTEGALYRHYKSKNEMAWKLFSGETETFSQELKSILFDAKKGNSDQLEAGIRFLYGYYEEHPIRFSFILLTQHDFPEEKLLNEEQNPIDMVTRFIDSVLTDKAKKQLDSKLTAAMIMGLLLQPIVMHRYGRIEESPLSMVGEVISACRKIVS